MDFETSSNTPRVLSEKDQNLINHNSSTKLTDFKRRKLEVDAARHWDIFYKNNTVNFFKDRRWLDKEFEKLGLFEAQEQSDRSDSDQSSETINSVPKLIEIGCGVGNTVFPLLEVTEKSKLTITATDFSVRACNFVKERWNNLEKESERDRLSHVFVSDLSKDGCFNQAEDILSSSAESIKQKLDFKNNFNYATLIFVLSAISPENFKTCFKNLKYILKESTSTSTKSKVYFRDYAINDHAMVRFKKGKCIQDRFYMRQDGTRSYFFTIEEVSQLVKEAGGEVESLEYINRRTTNLAEKVDVERVFIQGVFVF